MSEETERDDDEIVEEGGVVDDWKPVDQKHRTAASPVQQAFERIVREIWERIEVFRRTQIQGGTLNPWVPPNEGQW